MSPQQRKTLWDKFITGVKVWIAGLFQPSNTLQLIIGIGLFAKISYNGAGKAISFVTNANENTATCALLSKEVSNIKIARYTDSSRQSCTDNRQDTSIQGLRNLLVKQP